MEDFNVRSFRLFFTYRIPEICCRICVWVDPFGDGNGRIGRLLEKWFLAEKLGERAWYIQSEKFYYRNVNSYYHNLSSLGMFYEKLDYTKSIPFLLMLPQALRDEGNRKHSNPLNPTTKISIPHFQINITIPTRMQPAPAANRAETGSFKIRTEKRRVTTMLALSMEAT